MIPVKKNEKLNVTVSAVSSDGSGIARISGYALFIPQAITGDEAEVLVLKTKASYGYAKLLRLITPSPARTASPCQHFEKCGGCQLMTAEYGYQKELKRLFVKDALLRIGGIDTEPDFIGMDEPFRYRNKMVFPFDEDGKWGFYRERSHDVVPLSDCLLGDELCGSIMDTVSEYMKAAGVPPYNEALHTGVIRRVLIRNTEKELIVVISANADSLPESGRLIGALTALSYKITGIVLNINKKRTNLVLGDKNVLLWGKDTLSQKLMGLRYEFSPESFFQVNPVQTEKLYSEAMRLADISDTDTVLDIYCGIGTITLTAALKAKRAIGVEVVDRAISDARENAKRNGIENAEFHSGSAEELVPKIIENGTRPDIVILDPPRKGSDEETLSAIAIAAPERIVYISCNPATLARDIKFLMEFGYIVKHVTAVDMFPHTAHVETVVLLTQKMQSYERKYKSFF